MHNNKGSTVAILLAKTGIIPPREWYHDPHVKNGEGHTVAYYLHLKNI